MEFFYADITESLLYVLSMNYLKCYYIFKIYIKIVVARIVLGQNSFGANYFIKMHFATMVLLSYRSKDIIFDCTLALVTGLKGSLWHCWLCVYNKI